MIDSADDSKILNQIITTNRIPNRKFDSKSNRISKLRRSLRKTVVVVITAAKEVTFLLLSVCLLATLHKKASKWICMKFSGKVVSGPMNEWLNVVVILIHPDPYRNTGKTCLGRGMHWPSVLVDKWEAHVTWVIQLSAVTNVRVNVEMLSFWRVFRGWSDL